MYAVGSNGDPPTRRLTLNGAKLKWFKKVKHLGNFITFDLKDEADIGFKKGKFIGQVNKLLVKMSVVPATVRGRLLQTYCCSFHGAQAWDIGSQYVKQLNTEWNKAVRRVMRLPYKTHTRFLPYLVQGKPFNDQHFNRVAKFVKSFIVSKNVHVAFLGQRARYSSTGSLGRNFTRCHEPNQWLLNNDINSDDPVID